MARSFGTLFVFEYLSQNPLENNSKIYSFSGEDIKYLAVRNSNPNQEILLNFEQTRRGGVFEALLGKVNLPQNKMHYVQHISTGEHTESLAFPGGDHLLIIGSEIEQDIKMSKII